MRMKGPTARTLLQRLMVDQLVWWIDQEMIQIITRYRSYLTLREQRGEPMDSHTPTVEQLRQSLSEFKEQMALEAMQSLEVLLAAC